MKLRLFFALLSLLALGAVVYVRASSSSNTPAPVSAPTAAESSCSSCGPDLPCPLPAPTTGPAKTADQPKN